MGKVVKTVLKVAAVAAIAYFAPPLAGAALGSVGVSSALATTALSSAIGAGMGELSGVGWKAGALAAGLGGANSSGLFGGAPAAGAGAAPTTAGAAGAPAAAGTAGAALPGVEAYMASPGFTAAAGTEAAAAGVGGAAAAPQTIGQALSGAAAKPTSVLTGGISNITKGLGGAVNAVGLGGVAGGLNLGAVAPGLVAAGLTSTPGAAITRAQQAELARAQGTNAAITQQRIDEANKLIGEAAYYDPEYMARQAAEAAQIRGGIQETEGTRGLTGERLAAERRRYRLGTARSAGSAYQQGYGTGVSARTQTRQAGIQSLPTSFPTTSAESSAALRDRYMADEARRSQEAGLAALFGQALNRPTTT